MYSKVLGLGQTTKEKVAENDFKKASLKALTDPLERGREYTHSITTGKLEARIFFYLILKGLHHKISKKPLDAA
jgi:hypothetical protein